MVLIASILFATQPHANVKKEIEKMYKKWDTAIVKQDQKAMSDVLADSFKAIRKGDKKPLTKKEFIDGIAERWTSGKPKEISFKTKIKKLDHKEDTYFATVDETIVFAPVNGKSAKVEFTSIDTWQIYGNGWKITQTEPGE
ncbi:MAG: DUF4440 domain-containing protein [Armatimonadetes bacterium]|nr:DUF4440 domain-containing protein [Armatimonadota bacterium]